MADSSSAVADHPQLGFILEELWRQLWEVEWRFGESEPGLLSRIREFIDPEWRKVGDLELLNNLKNHAKELSNQWEFLRIFVVEVKKWSDADEVVVVHNWGSLIIKVDAKVDEIAKKLSIAFDQKYVTKKPSTLMCELQAFAGEISDLNSEIAPIFHSMLDIFSSVKLHSPLRDLSLWIKFAKSTKENLKLVDPGAEKHLMWPMDFIDSIHQSFPSGLKITGDDGQNQTIIEGFFACAAAVVFRVACMCHSFRFGATHELGSIADIVDEIISLVTPEFTLEFLKALNKASHDPAIVNRAFVKVFLKYTLRHYSSYSHTFIFEQLVGLIFFVIKRPEEPIDQDEDCSLAEIKQLIMEIIPALNYEDRTRNWLLEKKIWLGDVELFLKKILNDKITFFFGDVKLRELLDGLQEMRKYELEENEVTKFTEQVAPEFKSLYITIVRRRIKGDEEIRSLSLLFQKIVLFRALASLMVLLNGKETRMALSKDQRQALVGGLELFISFVTDKKVVMAVHEEKIHTVIEDIARRIITLSYAISSKTLTKETVADLLDKLKFIKAELWLFDSEFSRPNFPKKSAGLQFLDSLLGNILELFKRDPDSVAPFKNYMKRIQVDLVLLRSLLSRTSQEETSEILESEDLGTRSTKMTYELDYVIDSIEVGVGTHWQHMLWLHDIQEEITLINLLATAKFQEKTSEASVPEIPQISSHISRARTPETDKPGVRLTDQEEVIIDNLTRGSSQRHMLSIVGMPGLGKTTLANKVYDNSKVAYHFHRRAWCFVSQSYGKRDLLLKLLNDILGLTDDIQEMVDADLELKLWQCLKKNRYLIVMDDVWDVGAWNDLKGSFPDDGNGSRILITSRFRKVALDCMPDIDPHPLRVLSLEESWKLLEMRIFHEGGSCPEELEEVGKEIAEHCKGLPLAVVAIAGILKKAEKKYDWWKKISEELNTRVFDDPEYRCKEILELSYNHLPAHLKACFLYLGAFQEDRDVQVGKLIRLWIAEGFIQKTEPKSLEEIGEDYLIDLIDRSLVMVSKRKSLGGVKACRVHDLLRDLCRSISKQENFLQLITRHDEPYASFPYLGDGVDFDYDDPSNLAKYESHRVCIFLNRKHFVDSRPSGPCTRSLLFFASNDTYPRRRYNISFISENFKLLRVLDLECINLGASFPSEIELLVQLRYLALGGDMDSIPQSIANLWKLETFVIEGLSGKVVLPDSLWSMTSLRHVHVRKQAAFNLQADKVDISLQLDNLVTFSSPSFSCGKDQEKILRKLPNLVKLRCIFLESRDSFGNCYPFPSLDFLAQLESLNILYSGMARNLGEFNLPLNLRKLSLSKFHLSWNHISTIGRLPNLEVLKLHSGTLEGLIWDMSEDEFCKLKFLKLDSLNIVQWNATPDSLPQLQKLVLWNCKDLEEVPYEFCEISTLQIIEVQRCLKSLEESIRNIEESTEGIQVLINH